MVTNMSTELLSVRVRCWHNPTLFRGVPWIFMYYFEWFFHSSLTEVSSKGSQVASKRGLHRNTHKALTDFLVGRPPSARAVRNWSVFVRVFCKSVLFYTMVENFSHKSSIVSLLSVNPFSFPFSTLLSFTLEP